MPKTKRGFCKAKDCRKHVTFKVTQFKKGKDRLTAQGLLLFIQNLDLNAFNR